MDKTNINALVQTIERSLHSIYKNRSSIEQYNFKKSSIYIICLACSFVLCPFGVLV